MDLRSQADVGSEYPQAGAGEAYIEFFTINQNVHKRSALLSPNQ